MAGLKNKTSTVVLGTAGISMALLIASGWLVGDDNPREFDTSYRPTATVEEAPFAAFVTEEAVLESRQSVILASDLPSNSAKIVFLAPEGALMNPGDIVARFDPTEFEERILKIENDISDQQANIAEAEAERRLQKIGEKEEEAKLLQQVEFARLKLTELREGDASIRLARAQRALDKAEHDYAQAKTHMDTETQLLEKGLTRAKTHQQAVESEQESLAQLRIAQQDLRALSEVTIPGELRLAEIQFENRQRAHESFQQSLAHKQDIYQAGIARARNRIAALEQDLNAARLNLERTTITAPIPGMLLYKELSMKKERRKVQVGDALWNRQGFAVIPDMSAMVAVLQVRETELGKLAVGQPVRVEPQAFAGLQLSGSVESIGTLATDKNDDASRLFHVRVTLADTDERLRPGMTARAAIETSRLSQALQVPVEAVFYEGTQAVCFRLRNGRVERVEVILGVSDGQRVVVLDGLAPREEVSLVYPQSVDA